MLLDKTAPFFMLDKSDKTVQTKAGPCTLPIRYFSACNVMMFFAVDQDRARLLLPNRQFEPLPNEQGKALALVGFWDYFDTSIGPYNESTISLMVTYPGFDLPGCYANPGSGRQEPDQHLRVSELPVRVGSDLRGRQQGGAKMRSRGERATRYEADTFRDFQATLRRHPRADLQSLCVLPWGRCWRSVAATCRSFSTTRSYIATTNAST